MQLDVYDSVDQANDGTTDQRGNDKAKIAESFTCVAGDNGLKHDIGTNTHIKRSHYADEVKSTAAYCIDQC